MSRYALIDPILSQWAEARALHWYTDYQDTEVRALYLRVERRDRVQVALAPPDNGQVAIRIGQNRNGLSRLSRLEILTVPVAELARGLDRAMDLADDWLSDSSVSTTVADSLKS